MRQKYLPSPEKSPQESVDYRSKLLFLPYLSYAIAIAILCTFVFSIFALTLLRPISEGIWVSIVLLISELTLLTKFACIAPSISYILLKEKEISGVNFWGQRKNICWQEVISIKVYWVVGVRYFAIKTADSRSIDFSPSFHDIAQMLDRIRVLAGSEHI
jgi:hypothetical protein